MFAELVQLPALPVNFEIIICQFSTVLAFTGNIVITSDSI